MFKWLFKLFGYVPAEELEEMKEFLQQAADKAAKSVSSRTSSRMDARTLFLSMLAEGGKEGNDVGPYSFLDSEGDEDSNYDSAADGIKSLGEGHTDFALLNVDIPVKPGGEVGELWLMYSLSSPVEDISLETEMWNNTVY